MKSTYYQIGKWEFVKISERIDSIGCVIRNLGTKRHPKQIYIICISFDSGHSSSYEHEIPFDVESECDAEFKKLVVFVNNFSANA